MANKQDNAANEQARVDEATGTEFVGHEWDGIEELDTPMPRWWVWSFYATIVWGIVYVILYPAWPMIEKGTEGVLGWSSRGQFAEEMQAEEARRAPLMAALARIPIERLPENSEQMRAAIAGGAAAFKVNCVQCHGAGAAGSKGYPNLNDDDWIWGGDLKAIEYTLTHGIRWSGSDETRLSYMPAFGRDGMLTRDQISDVTSHVLSLSGNSEPNANGAAIYDTQCAFCHQPSATGNRDLGAPNLADAIWLYGGSRAEVEQQIYNPAHGAMPGWKDRLNPVTIKMLAAYIHSRGGGEDFVEVAADPEVQVDEQP
ncbi:cytochrome-c oxidase, cbb3-type subunit III [Pontixanthobacter aestiaquae]|uniref:Cbb3-type cytochrome c oxidase subunit n=1 Tax=Pontixanthobacter aestiaquae TaxID=1509367 RepID=A0A844Z2R0_9SPHN|nr:cytochrome-c oxidase, cbb3-type subunit III [Pontixanthobacter aestiaquae]MDN3647250.1 cytochrome-c oxidase, cbb3-type subunit III [Pontixanthobacter aestiaquae]MXO81774.1 cytochrome-c oxidase, cbb3-type subunit III [Pontixanthobacter aestiaquae]